MPTLTRIIRAKIWNNKSHALNYLTIILIFHPLIKIEVLRATKSTQYLEIQTKSLIKF